MGIGGFFLLLVLALVVTVAVLAITGNLTWLGFRGSDPEAHGAPGERESRDPDERPRHTRVDLEQNLQDRPRGEPADRIN